jgi:hypothetical protein
MPSRFVTRIAFLYLLQRQQKLKLISIYQEINAENEDSSRDATSERYHEPLSHKNNNKVYLLSDKQTKISY